IRLPRSPISELKSLCRRIRTGNLACADNVIGAYGWTDGAAAEIDLEKSAARMGIDDPGRINEVRGELRGPWRGPPIGIVKAPRAEDRVALRETPSVHRKLAVAPGKRSREAFFADKSHRALCVGTVACEIAPSVCRIIGENEVPVRRMRGIVGK